MVINGARQMVGSSAFQIYRAIDEESKRKPDDRITLQVANGEAIVRAESKRGAELIVVAFEDGAVTKVERGENRGRTIANDAIVRKLVRAGMVNGTVEKRVALALAPKMGVVAFLQDPQTHRIMVAATTTR
jgi:hypothetical protein